MADWTGVPGDWLERARVFRGPSRFAGSAHVTALRDSGAPFAASGVCPQCQIRVPLLTDGSPARHWPKRVQREVRLVPVRARSGYAPGTMQTVCAGSEVTHAGFVVIEAAPAPRGRS